MRRISGVSGLEKRTEPAALLQDRLQDRRIRPLCLPGLKFMRTPWVCNVAGGPLEYTATRPGKTAVGLEEAHRDLCISPAEFDEVAAELARTLDFVKVPKREKDEVLAAFAAHKNEVTAGYAAAAGR
jgi:hemoglobin